MTSRGKGGHVKTGLQQKMRTKTVRTQQGQYQRLKMTLVDGDRTREDSEGRGEHNKD